MWWIPITIGAASLQVARNALQRGLLAGAGPWGATLVRFLYGLPFSLGFVAVAAVYSRGAHPVFGPRFLGACLAGGGAQIVATAAMLVSMRRSSFALGTVFQQSGIPFAALIGMAFGERLDGWKWLGLALATAGLMALGWPRRGEGGRDWTAAPLGLVAGAGFAVAANAYRQSALALDPGHPVLAAQITLVVVQALQSIALVGWLSATDQGALKATLRAWRVSLGAGFFGAAASGLWFTAFALSPAGPVRAVGVVEMPIAALTGRRLFAERLSLWQIAAAAVTAAGVGLAALG
jgi:drug/metabolite transporter (DMT)-like permease